MEGRLHQPFRKRLGSRRRAKPATRSAIDRLKYIRGIFSGQGQTDRRWSKSDLVSVNQHRPCGLSPLQHSRTKRSSRHASSRGLESALPWRSRREPEGSKVCSTFHSVFGIKNRRLKIPYLLLGAYQYVRRGDKHIRNVGGNNLLHLS